MALNNNTFFQYKETRALAGYRSAWLVKHPDDNSGKYSLVAATETVPYVFGDKETFDFNLLQSPVIGQVEGKMSLESQDIEVLHHRDNAYRFEKLKGKVLEFMCINAEYVGYKFTGTLDYRPNNAEADVNRATVTIIPMDAETTPVFNARDEIKETLCFANEIPATVKTGETIDFAVKQINDGDAAGYKVSLIVGNEEQYADDVDQSDNIITFRAPGLYAITASYYGYAPWTTTVYVEQNSNTRTFTDPVEGNTSSQTI